jgi:hypothetical protein
VLPLDWHCEDSDTEADPPDAGWPLLYFRTGSMYRKVNVRTPGCLEWDGGCAAHVMEGHGESPGSHPRRTHAG